MSPVAPIPPGFRTLTPYLVVKDAAKAIEWYTQALGAKEIYRLPGPGGSVMHADLQIGDSRLMLCEDMPMEGKHRSPSALGNTSVTVHIYSTDADAAFDKAVAAGAKVSMPMWDAFWGDRFGKVIDPFGHEWSIGTRKKDMTPAEIQAAMMEAFAKMKPGCC